MHITTQIIKEAFKVPVLYFGSVVSLPADWLYNMTIETKKYYYDYNYSKDIKVNNIRFNNKKYARKMAFFVRGYKWTNKYLNQAKESMCKLRTFR